MSILKRICFGVLGWAGLTGVLTAIIIGLIGDVLTLGEVLYSWCFVALSLAAIIGVLIVSLWLLSMAFIGCEDTEDHDPPEKKDEKKPCNAAGGVVL